VELDLMAPRAGKSTGIAVPRVLRAQGAVLLTSNKSDVYAVTRAEREKVGTVWTFDPQGIAHTPREMWWDILAECHTIEGARRLAGHFVASVNDDTVEEGLLDLGRPEHPHRPVPRRRPRRGLRARPAGLARRPGRPHAHRPAARRRTDRDGRAVAGHGPGRGGDPGRHLRDRPAVRRLPAGPGDRGLGHARPELPQFAPHQHVLGRKDTLYLLSKDGGGSAAGVIAGLADATMRAGVVAAERMGGRLDPPMTAVLDEAANVCRISDLPDLYSHFGSRGINVVTLLQSYRQEARVWGEAGMDALWSAATIKLLGAGLDDADFVEKISRLVGQHDVKTHSISRSKDGTSRSVLLPAGAATGVRPARGQDPRPAQGHGPAAGDRRERTPAQA
jgi:hypothetical protein